MHAVKLAGLQPESFFAYFEKLCSIPHGSGKEKAISDYLVSFAKEHGIRYIQDELNNVLLFQEGTCGYEDHDPVILQGHMDMVCEKDEDCPIDMEKEGVDVTHDGEYVFAKGTTLGADDGVAVAYALALLADKSIPHPPLEVILTVNEEAGMDGAAGVDLSMLKGRTMINLDCGEENIFTVSCAGGARATIKLPVERRAVYGPCVKLSVEGLRGGHSGIMIHKKLANANKVMGQLLDRIQQQMPLCITSLQGGAKDNAIPRSCKATLVVLGMHPEKINEICQTLEEEIRTQYDEPEVKIYGEDADALGGNALTSQCSATLISLLNAVPNGVQAWSKDIDGLVETSLNLGVMNLEEDFSISFAVRSSVNQEKENLLSRLEQVAQFYEGSSFHTSGSYPAWEYCKDSRLQEIMISLFQKMFDREAKVIAIHAGLECGFLSEKLPGLDCVAMGPIMHDVHTSREKLNIASTQRMWKFLQEILKAL